MELRSIFKYFVSLSFLTITAYGKDYALVIGGTSTKGSATDHEFARGSLLSAEGFKARNYQVQTLFGVGNIEERISAFDKKRGVLPEKGMFQADYEEFSKRFPETKAITRDNILQSFENIIQNISKGDHVSIVINAHGHLECLSDNDDRSKSLSSATLYTGDFDSSCHHEISIISPNGQAVRFKTQEIMPYLQQMEEKGASVNLVMDSCHSGILKQEFSKLNSTCAILLASGDSVGYGCFEEDGEDSLDYTSTMEYIKYLIYAPIVDKLKEEKYFSQKKCFEKVINHAKKLGDDFSKSTISSAYWTARKSDMASHEPSFTDIFLNPYFRKGHYSNRFMLSVEKVCRSEIIDPLEELLGSLDQTVQAFFKKDIENLRFAIDRYNESIDRQKLLIEEIKKSDDEHKNSLITELERVQQLSQKLSKEIIAQERIAVDYIQYGKGHEDKENCHRSF